MVAKKETAQAFLKLTAEGKSREAFDLYVAREFRHHNAYFKGDPETLILAMEESSRQNPNRIFEIMMTLTDDEMVAVYSRVRQNPADPGAALAHFFRFDSDKIVEMWDIFQSVPENMVNENGMF